MSKKRLRWFSLEIDKASLKSLAGELLRVPYNAKRGHGFSIDEVRAGYILGRHIEKIEREFVSIDPNGRESRQRVTLFVTSRFLISIERPGLEVLDGSRSLKTLFTQLGLAAKHAISIMPIVTDPLAWLQRLNEYGLSVLVQDVEYTNIAVNRDISGTLRVTGEIDVRDAASKLLGSRRARVQRIKATVRRGDLPVQLLQLERNGRAWLLSSDVNDMHVMLRGALARVAFASKSEPSVSEGV